MRPSDKQLRRLGVSFIAHEAGISEYALKNNGLKILLAPDAGARSVVVAQLIHVGSRHEGAGNTGYSHLLEHMLFKGTPTHNKTLGNSYDQFCKTMGDTFNAMTWHDGTAYFAKIPSYALPEYLEHEADRLRNAILTDEDLSTEMQAVMDEFGSGENNPAEVLDKLLMAQAYTEHPYKVDVIGSRSEVLKVTAAALKERLYDVYYWPNNVTLVVSGAFDEGEALQMIAGTYGKLPRSPHPIPTPYTVEPPQFGERRFVIHKPGDLARVAIGYHVPEADHKEFIALKALAMILGGSESSRLYRKLADKGLAAMVYSQLGHMHDPSLFKIVATVAPTTKPALVERIILKEVARLARTGVSASELKRVKALTRNAASITKADRLNSTLELIDGESVADWHWTVGLADRMDEVTREDIAAVAARYLVANNRTVGYFLPDNGETEPMPEFGEFEGGAGEEQGLPPVAYAPLSETPDTRTFVTAGGAPQAGNSSYAQQATRVILPNGLKLVLLPTKTESAVGFTLCVNAGSSKAPAENRSLAGLTADMLTRGSAAFSKKRIGELTTELMLNYNWNVEPCRSSLHTLVPPAALPRFLDLLADSLRNPSFDESEFELAKKQAQAQLTQAEQDPSARASIALSQELYNPDSPLYQTSLDKQKAQIAAATTADLRAFHQSAYGPTGAVLSVVGKFDVAEMRKLLEEKLGSWSGGTAPTWESQLSSRSARKSSLAVDIPGKDTLTVMIGQPVDISIRSPDYAAAVIANKALGGDTISSRLGYQIRELRGLTYGVYCGFHDHLVAGAPWAINMTTDAVKVEPALPLIPDIVFDFAEHGIRPNELALEKRSLLSGRALSLDDPLPLSGVLANWEYGGSSLEEMDAFESRVANLTKEEVDAAIRKYFMLGSAVQVVAGTLPEDLKPRRR